MCQKDILDSGLGCSLYNECEMLLLILEGERGVFKDSLIFEHRWCLGVRVPLGRILGGTAAEPPHTANREDCGRDTVAA